LQIVILAAGMGTRLEWNEQNMPKSLVPIHDQKPYLWYQLNSLSRFSISNIVLVGGFGIDHLKKFLKDHSFSPVILLNNKDFKKGNLLSLLVAKDTLEEDFYIFNADHYYSLENYKKIFKDQNDKITIFCDRDRNLIDDDMKVDSNEGQLIKMDKKLPQFDLGYVGVTYIPKKSHDVYWKNCYEVGNNRGDQANVESVLNHLVPSGIDVKISDISGSWWTEIDSPDDLAKAREMIQRHEMSAFIPT